MGSVAAAGRVLVSLARTRFLLSSSRLRVSSCVPRYIQSFKSITAKRPLSTSSTFSTITPKQSNKSMADSIRITSLEHKIFDTLKAVLVHFQLNIQLRVAGGWVRDKLLGKDCHDIDIALEDMLGKAFCDKVNEYLVSINQQARNVSVIQSNPDQSKHLETARMKIFGVELDFVNLRAETYAENSRIPTMKFGTPKEDALRRDLTINSLFYNINTGSIEDFTGRGLSDLHRGIIATPLPPKTTFLDDPLRVLRAVRFAARFDYEIQEDVREAAADLDVRTALLNKVSPERVGVEIDLMITGANPVRAVRELVDLGLFWVVFRLPQELKNNVPDELQRLCLGTFNAMFRVLAMFGASKLTIDQRRIGLYAALLLPLKSFNVQWKKKQTCTTRSFFVGEVWVRVEYREDGIGLSLEATES
ncbi:hypothetical protein L7F22_032895 [Adiantum nelumboides]|nr:hypothetical protein [Adiantum nelumboides]